MFKFDEVMVLNSSYSYDPDDPDSVLIFSWRCPSPIGEDLCLSFVAEDGSLSIKPLDRIKLGF